MDNAKNRPSLVLEDTTWAPCEPLRVEPVLDVKLPLLGPSQTADKDTPGPRLLPTQKKGGFQKTKKGRGFKKKTKKGEGVQAPNSLATWPTHLVPISVWVPIFVVFFLTERNGTPVIIVHMLPPQAAQAANPAWLWSTSQLRGVSPSAPCAHLKPKRHVVTTFAAAHERIAPHHIQACSAIFWLPSGFRLRQLSNKSARLW